MRIINVRAASVPVRRRMIVGIPGATRGVNGPWALQLLRNSGVETHLVMSWTVELSFARESRSLKIF